MCNMKIHVCISELSERRNLRRTFHLQIDESLLRRFTFALFSTQQCVLDRVLSSNSIERSHTFVTAVRLANFLLASSSCANCCLNVDKCLNALRRIIVLTLVYSIILFDVHHIVRYIPCLDS